MKSCEKYEILKEFEETLIILEDILGDKATSNIQLLKIGKRIFGDRFKNVYCSNDSIRLKNNECCIVNTDSSKQEGSHWISLYKYKDHYFVWDSFARDIHTLSKFFRFKKWINVEHPREESFKSSSCGQLSMAWMLLFDKYKLKCIGVI